MYENTIQLHGHVYNSLYRFAYKCLQVRIHVIVVQRKSCVGQISVILFLFAFQLKPNLVCERVRRMLHVCQGSDLAANNYIDVIYGSMI